MTKEKNKEKEEEGGGEEEEEEEKEDEPCMLRALASALRLQSRVAGTDVPRATAVEPMTN